MASRLELHELLCSLLGSRNVYFGAPEGVKMSYPAIKYSLEKREKRNADDKGYIYNNRYQLIVISNHTDEPVINKLLDVELCSHDRSYRADGLWHDVFTLFY